MAVMLELGTSHTPLTSRPRPLQGPAFAAVLALHIVVALVLVRAQRWGLGAEAEGSVHGGGGGIAAFIDPGSIGTSGFEETRKVTLVKEVPTPRKPASTGQTGQSGQAGTGAQAAGSATGGGGDGTGGPVRIGTGLMAISKVSPIYPPIMQQARREGTVVLDAIIHRDGTVGDIKVLESSGLPFEQAAITAVGQWRYTSQPQEGILTVRVNFTLP